MRNILSGRIPLLVGILLGLTAAIAVFVPSTMWAQKVTVEPVTSRVISVGPAESSQYQCGSNKIGDVTIPTYCTRTEYPVTFSVANTDETFTSELTSAPQTGTEYASYKIIDDDVYSYSLTSPKSVGYNVMMGFLALVVGIVVGIISFMISTFISDRH